MSKEPSSASVGQTAPPASERYTYVRGVSGWGPRCGCGGKSTLHVGFGRRTTPDSSTFLCERCVVAAISMFFDVHPEQPPYWPSDEDRDEHYVNPNASAA